MPPSFPFVRACWAAGLLSALAGCAVGPDYVRPAPPAGVTQAAFKEGGHWQPAAPGTADIASPWWKLYGDPALDPLVDEALRANQTLRQAEAQYAQAQALLQGAEAAGWPSLSISASPSRARTNTNTNNVQALNSSHTVSLQASWELPLWGRVSRAEEAAGASAEASAADLAGARLTIQAAVVNAYLQLRLNDRLLALYQRTVQAYEKSLQLTQSQYRAGVATRSDVALAEATLKAAQAQAVDVALTRRQTEHALAVLLGKAPAAFSLAANDAPLPAVPAVPALLPSTLLERRPDIAAAERRVSVANANIGLAESAWFPTLTLGASAGNSGFGLGPWFSTADRVWAVGATLAATLFDGGQRSAQDAQARAAFDAAAATYKQTVLAGFQEVEDNLAALDELARELTLQREALQAARESERVLTSQYRAGTTTYLSVITAQALTLTDERTVLQLESRQVTASVALIKAIGGGWNARQLSPELADGSAQSAAQK